MARIRREIENIIFAPLRCERYIFFNASPVIAHTNPVRKHTRGMKSERRYPLRKDISRGMMYDEIAETESIMTFTFTSCSRNPSLKEPDDETSGRLFFLYIFQERKSM